jgi:serine/threonine-protein kinase
MPDDLETRGTRADPGAPTIDGDASNAATEPAETRGDETIVPTWGGGGTVALPDPGYQLGVLIGRGGMGEVVVAHDQRIGREVAVKRIRSRTPTHDAVTRFLREARIQARLDHPAIVPVYELGTDHEDRPYFTMKRLAGTTLQKRLSDGGSTQPLLRAFVDVCLAIQLAHSRGVVHRDLKPSNIMLGDYGEVYVLDWGVARVLADRKRTTRPQMAVDVDEDTTAGAILGTPGYMSPEQIRGLDVSPASDVYALGAILFEILAGEPLHPRGDGALATTLTHPQVAPAKRAPDRAPPPELDGACFDALAENAGERPTARELADRVQAYLDGDRDFERRRSLAAEQLALAQDALERDTDDSRATAIRRAGRALALDPESGEAAELVTKLMLEPPKRLPPDLVDSLEDEDRRMNSQRARTVGWITACLFGFWALIPFLQVKSWTNLLAFYGLIALGVLSAANVVRTGKTRLVPTLVVIALIVVAFTRVAGPFVLTPIIACSVMLAMTAMPENRGRPWLIIGTVIGAMVFSLVLEHFEVINSTYLVQSGFLISRSDIFDMRDNGIDAPVFVFTNLLFIAMTGVLAYVLNDRRARAQRQLHIQAWHLRQMLPTTSKFQTKPERQTTEKVRL